MTKEYSTEMFEAVCKAVANEDNWQYANGTMELLWDFVDADVALQCGPEKVAGAVYKTLWNKHYRQFYAAFAALEKARGKPFPTKENRS